MVCESSPKAANLDDEEGRLRALQRLDVLDTGEEAPFEKIADLVRQVLHVPMCAVSLVDRDRQWFKTRRGLADPQTARDISFCTHAIRADTPFIVADALGDPRFADNPSVRGDPNIRSYAGIPLLTPDGYAVGALCAIDSRPREFTSGEIDILKSFAEVVVDELQLRQIAASDALTGALSRRAWMEHARGEWSRAGRHERPLSVAILDLDHFKRVNDTFGHPAGDRVIQALAETCRGALRVSDRFGRLGGEEFAMLLPETPGPEGQVVADRARAAFARARVEIGDQQIAATVSIGVADRSRAASLEDLIAAADQALYVAKLAGRNTVRLAGAMEVAEPPARVA